MIPGSALSWFDDPVIRFRPECLSLLQFLVAFIPFGLLLLGTFSPDALGLLHLNETKAAIWGTTAMLLGALSLSPFGTASRRIANVAMLYWSFGLLIFLVHVYLTVFVIFDGPVDAFDRQGRLIAIPFLVTAWWTVDVVLIWLTGSWSRGLARAHDAGQVFIFLVFADGLLARSGRVHILGIAFTATVLDSLGAWLLAMLARHVQATHRPSQSAAVALAEPSPGRMMPTH
jgi:hypothetical protein